MILCKLSMICKFICLIYCILCQYIHWPEGDRWSVDILDSIATFILSDNWSASKSVHN